MKITIDTNTGICKVGSKEFKDLEKFKQETVEQTVRNFIRDNTQLNMYDEDCMWMSYRYAIPRHTIAAHMHASNIWKNCRGRMRKERELFTAYDINREIENTLTFFSVNFRFPISSHNKIYATAVDIVCSFIEEYNIKSKEELLEYKEVEVEYSSDNERGFKLNPVKWDDYIIAEGVEHFKKFYNDNSIDEAYVIEKYNAWKNKEALNTEHQEFFDKLNNERPNKEYFYMHDFEDLFVWNDLVHCFDFEKHHKSVLIDGSECVWFWTWTSNSEKREDGFYYKSFWLYF